MKVLYVMGWGRSGSTLLDNLLGEVDGFFSSGELRKLWQEGLTEGRKCGCGMRVSECRVWSNVLPRVLGENSSKQIRPSDVVQWERQALRTRHTWRVLHASSSGGRSQSLEAYRQVSSRVYLGIQQVTGARVIVDSSKMPSHAALLKMLPEVTPYFIHLVRDPRAAAYSWQRRKARLDLNGSEEMPRFGLLHSTFSWTEFNFAAEAVRRRYPPESSMLIRYEDFVAEPRDTLRQVIEFVEETSTELPFVNDHTAQLTGNHTVSGNPSRFGTGTVHIRNDNEWVTRQRAADRLIATTLSLPILHRYGYPLRVNRPKSIS